MAPHVASEAIFLHIFSNQGPLPSRITDNL